MLVVFNKMDRVEDPAARAVLRRHFPDAIFISVHSGDGLEALVERIGDFVSKNTGHVEPRLPPERADLLARLHREGAVHAVEYEEDAIRVRATLPDRLSESLAEFLAPMKSAPRTPTGAAV
jgi:GTP-binding protein HflX